MRSRAVDCFDPAHTAGALPRRMRPSLLDEAAGGHSLLLVLDADLLDRDFTEAQRRDRCHRHTLRIFLLFLRNLPHLLAAVRLFSRLGLNLADLRIAAEASLSQRVKFIVGLVRNL